MSKTVTFLKSIKDKDLKWFRDEITKRDTQLRTLKFDLGFGKVSALSELRRAKRERAQLLTLMHQITKPAAPDTQR